MENIIMFKVAVILFIIFMAMINIATTALLLIDFIGRKSRSYFLGIACSLAISTANVIYWTVIIINVAEIVKSHFGG